MSYQTNQELPASIRTQLSETAQHFYRVAFNSALQWYGNETKAHQIAWSAVRNQAVSLNSGISNSGISQEPYLAVVKVA
ncbi:MAG: ChaB family protein [Phormidesmis sp. CAN_BIN36]|nr:ChaB family protein [Phormidesmis sp. CAN_BIN36]